MSTPATPPRTNCIQFCQQKVLYADEPYSPDQLSCMLEIIYTDHESFTGRTFTGYLKFVGEDCTQLFLFFFKGSPYAAGRYTEGKPTIYTIQELARQLVKADKTSLTMTLCETDPVLLKSMLLFLQKEPAVKAPTSLIDFEHIVQQLGTVGEHAVVALRRDNAFNFFFFKNGTAALAYYADSEFKRPGDMTLEEEMLLYAYQPGKEIQAYVYRDMNTTVVEDSSQYDRESLYTLLTVGYLKNKRKGDQQQSAPSGAPDAGSADGSPQQVQRSRLTLFVEAGPLAGERLEVALPCTIGRKECDLILDDRLVSRRHAELTTDGGAVTISDLGSKNGTLVNGRKISRSPLAPNDLIAIGPIRLRVLAA